MPKNSPPLLFAATTGATPFRVNLHVSDLGHTLLCGPSGAGKSTALGLIAAQWFRYPCAQVFAFDKGYSLFVLTKAAGGEFYDLAGEKSDLAFCPLSQIDSDADLTWAVTWLDDLCSLNGLAVTPKHRNALTQALLQLRLSPSRTLTELSANVQDLDVREALQFYTLSGPLGQLLDADEDSLSSGRFLTFETENLLQLDNKAVVPVLLYLFRRIEKRLDGSPTLVSLDEAWAYLSNDVFRERLRDWLKTLRRMNGIVLLSTQNLSDICNSEISDVILEMCPTKILLPNGEAKNPASKVFYDRVGMNSRELGILETSIPKQHYYVISPLGRRLISLGIHNVALSFVGVNGREERQLVEDLLVRFPDTWQSEWLRARARTLKDDRLAGWGDYYEKVQNEFESNNQCAKA
jgi:type IV secretion system protein VirB4